MISSVLIDGKLIGGNNPPYVIAEMSANHNGDKQKAFQLLEIAKYAGASAVKLQTYTPDTITLDVDSSDFLISEGPWAGRTLYDLYKEAYMPWDWQKELFEYAKKIGITIFSSPFDRTAVDFLETLNAPAYKIASFEAIDLPLIRYVASTRKPMIISTGMANEQEIGEAIQAARDAGCKELIVLHCVSGYPAKPEEYNLKTMVDIMAQHQVVVGVSDHTLTNTTSICSISMGGSVVEKHFTIDRSMGGVDASFSLEPSELAALCNDVRLAWNAIGQINYEREDSELGNVKFRRSLYFVNNLRVGDLITASDIRSVRPGFGLPPNDYEFVIGKKLSKEVAYGTPVTMDCLVVN